MISRRTPLKRSTTPIRKRRPGKPRRGPANVPELEWRNPGYLRFLREDFAGDVSRAVLLLQLYVEVFQEREYADMRLRDYMVQIGDTGTAVWDHATQTVILPILTEDQKKTKEPLCAASAYWQSEQRDARTKLLELIYGGRRDEDDDEDTYGCGVDEDQDEDPDEDPDEDENQM